MIFVPAEGDSCSCRGCQVKPDPANDRLPDGTPDFLAYTYRYLRALQENTPEAAAAHKAYLRRGTHYGTPISAYVTGIPDKITIAEMAPADVDRMLTGE